MVCEIKRKVIMSINKLILQDMTDACSDCFD
jgi:hypothetical protein